MVTEAALFAFQVTGLLHTLSHDKFGVPDAGRFDRIVHGLHFRLIDLLGGTLKESEE